MNATLVTHEVPTGDALFKARLRVGSSLAAAAAALQITETSLSDYESGLRTPNSEMIDQIADLYGIERGRLVSRPWVPRVPPHFDAESGTLSLGWHSIQVKQGDNDHLLRSVASALRSMRSLREESPILLRTAELPLLGSLMDLTDPDLVDTMVFHLRINPADALGMINEMVAMGLG